MAWAADFMLANPFSTQTSRAANAAFSDFRNTIPRESLTASTISGDLRETRNIPPTQNQTEVPIHRALTLTPEQARAANADGIFKFFWRYVVQLSIDTAPTPATCLPPAPSWQNVLHNHLQQAAESLAAAGFTQEQVARRFRAILEDVRSDNWWLRVTRGVVREALPFAIGSLVASVLGTFVGPALASVADAAEIAMYLVSGAVIMLCNAVGAALFDTAVPSLRGKLPQTTPAHGLEHLNTSIHSLGREVGVSALAFAGIYGGVRNLLRLGIEHHLLPHSLMSGRLKNGVHAALEIPLAVVGMLLRWTLDRWRTPQNNAAVEILLQHNLSDLLMNDLVADANTTSALAEFSERFFKIFCSWPTGLLCGLLTVAFADIEWRDDVAARADTDDWERKLLNQLDFAKLYAAIGCLLQLAASCARNRDISSAYQRREPNGVQLLSPRVRLNSPELAWFRETQGFSVPRAICKTRHGSTAANRRNSLRAGSVLRLTQCSSRHRAPRRRRHLIRGQPTPLRWRQPTALLV